MASRRWAGIGIPDDKGVIRVGGRIGSAGGPIAFQKIFKNLRGREAVHSACLEFRMAGTTHRQAADTIKSLHASTGLSVVIGGAHDHGYSQLLGISEALKGRRIACINIDAHFDVRKPAPEISSGSPFYLAIESGVLDPARFIEFGIQRHCNAPELWDYVAAKKIETVLYDELRDGSATRKFGQCLDRLEAISDAIVVSLDLDAAAQAYAPGVSAPQAEGFSSREIITMVENAGKRAKCVSLGIFELNPAHDVEDLTSRLAATAAYHFVAAALGA